MLANQYLEESIKLLEKIRTTQVESIQKQPK